MEANVIPLEERAKIEAKSYLEQLLAEGARKLLQAAIENKVAEYLQSQGERGTESEERSVVRRGHLPERHLVTGVGPVKNLISAHVLSGIQRRRPVRSSLGAPEIANLKYPKPTLKSKPNYDAYRHTGA